AYGCEVPVASRGIEVYLHFNEVRVNPVNGGAQYLLHHDTRGSLLRMTRPRIAENRWLLVSSRTRNSGPGRRWSFSLSAPEGVQATKKATPHLDIHADLPVGLDIDFFGLGPEAGMLNRNLIVARRQCEVDRRAVGSGVAVQEDRSTGR